MRVPLSVEHCNHPVGRQATVGHVVDARVIDKIHELVKGNVTNPTMVSKCVKQFVEK